MEKKKTREYKIKHLLTLHRPKRKEREKQTIYLYDAELIGYKKEFEKTVSEHAEKIKQAKLECHLAENEIKTLLEKCHKISDNNAKAKERAKHMERINNLRQTVEKNSNPGRAPQIERFAFSFIQSSKNIHTDTIPEDSKDIIRYDKHVHSFAKLKNDLYHMGWFTNEEIAEKEESAKQVLSAAKAKGAWRNAMRKKGLLDEKGNLNPVAKETTKDKK